MEATDEALSDAFRRAFEAALDSAKETFCNMHLGVEGNFDDSRLAFVRTNRPRPLDPIIQHSGGRPW